MSVTRSNFAEETELAASYDRRGDHDEAINVLARATKRGNVEAMTQLGKRLLVGDRAPYLPGSGARFLFDAAKLGGPEAADRLSVLVGGGIYFRQSWNDALNVLLTSAERGWEPAQDQIRILASSDELAELSASDSPPADIWRRLVMNIDFSFWNRPPQTVTLSESPLIRHFAGLVPPQICSWLVERARDRLAPAKVYDSLASQDTIHSTRTNSAASFNLAETDFVTLLVQTRMVAACGLPLAQMEAATVLHYDVGQEITEHYDFVDPHIPNYAEEIETNGQRLVTFLIYLNEDYDGGETAFPKLGLSHRGRLGEGLYFVNALANREPDLRTVHAGRPPLRGEKWVLSQFIRDRQVLAGIQADPSQTDTPARHAQTQAHSAKPLREGFIRRNA